MKPELLTELNEGLLILTLNRAERRNALSPTLMSCLSEAAYRAANDSAVRAVLIRGAGGYFCVGGDVRRMASGGAPQSREALRADLYKRTSVSKAFYNILKPVVAQVDGAAAGAGLGLALACDIQIAGANAKITTAFAKVGLSGDFATSYYVTQMLGVARTAELFMLAPTLSGMEAAAIGLLSKSVPDDQVAETALRTARKLASGPTFAFGRIKQNIRNAVRLDYDAYFDEEVDAQVACIGTEDHKSAALAFLEKSLPAFYGR